MNFQDASVLVATLSKVRKNNFSDGVAKQDHIDLALRIARSELDRHTKRRLRWPWAKSTTDRGGRHA